jgi:superfamily II DNA helicase RecQ
VLREVFGFDSFRSRQLAMIEQVVAAGDSVVAMPIDGAGPSHRDPTIGN